MLFLSDAQLESKAYGALLGIAVGDAMGMPVEMQSRAYIKKKFSLIDTFLPGDDVNPICKGFVPCETTDDTYMSMLVAENLCDTKGVYSVNRFVEDVLKWDAEEGKNRTVIGPSTRAALEQIQRGIPPEEAGKNGVTNGAAMKIIPAGIICSLSDKRALVRLVYEICKPTHNTTVANAGACSIAAVIAGCFDGINNLSSLIETACECAVLGESQGYETVGPSVVERIRWAINETAGLIDDEHFLDVLYYRIGTGLPIMQTVPAAFAIFNYAQGDVMRAAGLAANVGGDTDTIGAIACGMCGAWYGDSGIPQKVKSQIENTNHFDFFNIAKRLLGVRQGLHRYDGH